MSLTITLRPSATSSSTGWSAVPSGTLHGVTSDNNDSTYALWSGSGAPMVLQTPVDSPGAGYRRHQVRVRTRGQLGDAWWGVRLQSGLLVAGATRQFPASPETSIGSWGFGAPPDGATILAAHVEGQSSTLRVNEIFLDVDFREAPDFTPQTLDGAGTVTTTITDTATPTLHADAIDLDGLPARQYRYWVTQGATIVFDTGIVSGAPADTQTSPLANGSYTFRAQIWTTVGDQYEYASTEKTLAFTVGIDLVDRPNDPIVTQVPGSPLWEITVCAPYVGYLDGGTAHVEIQRVSCGTATSIAMMGPLETDECATYADYSVPRTGLPATADCDHDLEECCSFYRARTIGRIAGSVVISAWSDDTDPGLPSGLIFAWPSTNASIPSGWTRQTELDDHYLKGAPAGIQPVFTGGAFSHTHTLPPHSHDVSHSHTLTGPTSAAVGTVASTPNTAGALNVLATHTHTVPASTGTTTVSSGTAQPVPSTVNNDPDNLRVIWIASNGTPAGVPNGALGLTAATSITGWTDFANATARYLKGAAPGADGGATAAGTLANHTHAIPVHSHTGTAHTHTGGTTGTASSTIAAQTAGANSVVNAATHAHPITINSAGTAALDSGSGGSSGASSEGANEPPFINIRVKQNTSGGASLPVGIIAAWRGSLGTIPNHFQLCDGTNGTLDLRDRHPKGATSSIGTTGGSLTAHTHTTPSHGHTNSSSHSHTVTIGAQNAATATATTAAAVTVSSGTHTHTLANTGSTSPVVGASTSGTMAAQTAEPRHRTAAFVQLMEPFTPDPGPETFCLTWTPDEHLIRSASADGALWAPVIGTFAWERDRPFTANMGVEGGRFVVSAAPGERNLKMTAAVESEAALQELLAVLARPLVLISPSDSTEVWAAPIAASVSVVKVGRIRQISADFIGTGPQPGPQVEDV